MSTSSRPLEVRKVEAEDNRKGEPGLSFPTDADKLSAIEAIKLFLIDIQCLLNPNRPCSFTWLGLGFDGRLVKLVWSEIRYLCVSAINVVKDFK